MKDYAELVRKSIRKDFANANFKRNAREPRVPHPLNTKRILSINEKCEYYKFRKFFVGKLIRIVEDNGQKGVWVEFVRLNDGKKLNNAAGWSDSKRLYLLHGARFDD